MKIITAGQIASDLRALGLSSGDVVFLHSSLASLGLVEGGSKTVVEAFLRVLGRKGTLAVPVFTFFHGAEENPVFDPANDRSEMGAITEHVRLLAGARRSRHLTHSVAAIGKHAQDITAVQGASAWAGDGPFWQLYWLNAYNLLLGVPYLRCTYFHIIEQLVQVPYRKWSHINGQIRKEDGQLEPLPTLAYTPKPGFNGNDFNKLGQCLEQQNLSRPAGVANAVARLFLAKDALRVGITEYRQDPDLFVKTGEQPTPLEFGLTTNDPKNPKCVLDQDAVYGKSQAGE